MFLQVPATRDMFSAHFGNGVREVVKPGHFAGFSNNGMGLFSVLPSSGGGVRTQSGWESDNAVPSSYGGGFGLQPSPWGASYPSYPGNAYTPSLMAQWKDPRGNSVTTTSRASCNPWVDGDCDGMNGMAGWFDGVDWGSLIETGAKASATIATAQWGQPNLKPGQSIQRVKNSDGSFSEVLMQQPAGLPAGGNAIVAGAAGVSSGMLMMVGIGAVLLFTMQGRGR